MVDDRPDWTREVHVDAVITAEITNELEVTIPDGVAVTNFPTEIDIGNLPTEIDIGNLPSSYPSTAEAATKLVKTENVGSAGDCAVVIPTNGKRVVILCVAGSGETAGDSFKLQAYAGSAWVTICEEIFLQANGHFYFTYPCWKPTQDVGDGTNGRIKLVVAGTGTWTGQIVYYEE